MRLRENLRTLAEEHCVAQRRLTKNDPSGVEPAALLSILRLGQGVWSRSRRRRRRERYPLLLKRQVMQLVDERARRPDEEHPAVGGLYRHHAEEMPECPPRLVVVDELLSVRSMGGSCVHQP